MLRTGRILVVAAFVLLACVVGYVCLQWPQDPSSQFRWNWWVGLLSSLATFGAVIVALFRENIRPWFFRYSLAFDLWNPRGVATPTNEGQRWFHLRVTNPHRAWLAVQGVRVVVLRVDLSENRAPFKKVWEGHMRFHWAHETTLEEGPERTLGGEARADLCWVDKKLKVFDLALAHHPNELPHPYRSGQAIRVWLRAQGHEADSPIRRVEIDWDDVWEDDEEKMAEHFRVRFLEDAA